MKILFAKAAIFTSVVVFVLVSPRSSWSLKTTTTTTTTTTISHTKTIKTDKCNICSNSLKVPSPDALIPTKTSLLEDVKTCQEFQTIANSFTEEDEKCQTYFQRIGSLHCDCDDEPMLLSSTKEKMYSDLIRREVLQEGMIISSDCEALQQGEFPEDRTQFLNNGVEEQEFHIYLDVTLSNDDINLQQALKALKQKFDPIISVLAAGCNSTNYHNEQQEQQDDSVEEDLSYTYAHGHIWSVRIFPNESYDYYSLNINQVNCIEQNRSGPCTPIFATVRALYTSDHTVSNSTLEHTHQLQRFLKDIIRNELPFIANTIDVLESVALVRSSERNAIGVTFSPTAAPTTSCDDILCGIYSTHENVQTSMIFSFDLVLDQDILPETISSELVDLFHRKMSAFAAGCEVFSHAEDVTLAIYNQYVHPISVQDVYRIEFSFTSDYFSEGDFTLIDGECESANPIEGTSCYPSTGFVTIFWEPIGGLNNSTLNSDLEGYIQDIVFAEMNYLSNDISSVRSISVLDFLSEPSIAPSTNFSSGPDCESLLNGIFEGTSTYKTSYFMHFDVTPMKDGNLTVALSNLKDEFDRKISALAAECIVENEGYTNDGPTILHVQLFPHEDFDYYTLDDISCEDANQDFSCVSVLGVISISFISTEPVSSSIKENLIEYVKYIIEEKLPSLVPNIDGLSSISITNHVPYSPAPSSSYYTGVDDDDDDDDMGVCNDLLSGKFPSLDESTKTTALTMMMDLVLEAMVPFEDTRDLLEINLEHQVSAYAAGCSVVEHDTSGVDIVKEYENQFNIHFVKLNMVLFHYGTCSITASISGICYPMIVDVDIKYQPLSRRRLGRLLGEADEIQEFVFGIIQREMSSIVQDIVGIEAVTVVRSMDAPIVTLNNGSKTAIGLSVSISIIAMSVYTFRRLKKKRSEKEFDGPMSLDDISQSADDDVLRNWNSNNATNLSRKIQNKNAELSDHDIAILQQWSNKSSSVRPSTQIVEKQMKLSQYHRENAITSQPKTAKKMSNSNTEIGMHHISQVPNLNSSKRRHGTTEINSFDDDDLSIDESCNHDDFVDNDDDISVISDYMM